MSWLYGVLAQTTQSSSYESWKAGEICLPLPHVLKLCSVSHLCQTILTPPLKLSKQFNAVISLDGYAALLMDYFNPLTEY